MFIENELKDRIVSYKQKCLQILQGCHTFCREEAHAFYSYRAGIAWNGCLLETGKLSLE